MLKLLDLEIRNPADLSLEDYKIAQHIITMNIEQLVLAAENPDYKRVLEEASCIIPDGESIAFLSFLLGKPVKKYAGIDLASDLLNNSETVVFWGASSEVNDSLRNSFDNGVFFQNGFYDIEDEITLIKKIPKVKVDLFLVALGSPRQEIFINKYKDSFPNTTFIGVGGSFDIWAGKLTRAPKYMIDMKLEWLYRIYQEPYRIKKFSKNLFALLKFLFYNGNI